MVNLIKVNGGYMISIIDCKVENFGTGFSIDSLADVYMSGNKAINCGVGLHIIDGESRQAPKKKLPDGHFRLSNAAFLVNEHLQKLRQKAAGRG